MKNISTAAETISSSPIFRQISFSDSGKFSPWSARLTGIENWEKTERNIEDVLKEYNEGWYASLLQLWQEFSASSAAGASPAAAQRFFFQVWKHIAAEVVKNKEIYRSSKENYLFSAGDEFVTGDLMLGQLTHQNLIINYVEEQISRHDLRTVVEPGCGSGVNLFYLYSHLNLDEIRGGEICSNAVELGNRISEHCGIPGKFRSFDYREKQDLQNLTEGLDDYLLITCHSIEQVQVRENKFIENILDLPNPPKIVIHFEPIVWDDDSMMTQLCRRYAEKNKYNLDLLDVVRELENDGRLEILDVRKRCFGLSAYNPTSVLCWRTK